MHHHRFDALSAALGVLTVAIGLLVAVAEIDSLGADTGVWIALGVLVVGLGLIPWSVRPGRDHPASSATDTPDSPGDLSGA